MNYLPAVIASYMTVDDTEIDICADGLVMMRYYDGAAMALTPKEAPEVSAILEKAARIGLAHEQAVVRQHTVYASDLPRAPQDAPATVRDLVEIDQTPDTHTFVGLSPFNRCADIPAHYAQWVFLSRDALQKAGYERDDQIVTSWDTQGKLVAYDVDDDSYLLVEGPAVSL